MLRRACPLLTGVLAVGLALTRRRLAAVRAELDHVRAELAAPVKSAGTQLRAETVAVEQPGAASIERTAEPVMAGSDLSSDWEQAVPPTDS